MKILKFILKYLDDVLMVAGIIFLFIGTYKIYIPAGYITLGVCLIAFAFIFSKGMERR